MEYKTSVELQRVYEYIKNDSSQNAETVRKTIIQRTELPAKFPERYPLDVCKINDNGEYLRFEVFHDRISYKIMSEDILIVRMKHTSGNLLKY